MNESVAVQAAEETPRPAPAIPSAAELAAALAARLCHDFISPASAIASGVDLLEDPDSQDMREDALSLIADSAKKLGVLLPFYRVAFGASASADTFDARELRAMAEGLYRYQKAELSWDVPFESLDKPAARAALNLVQLGAMVLPRGGEAKFSARRGEDGLVLQFAGEGPKINFKPEVAEGLSGKAMTDGLIGYWVQAYYLAALVAEAGGSISFAAEELKVSLAVRLPA